MEKKKQKTQIEPTDEDRYFANPFLEKEERQDKQIHFKHTESYDKVLGDDTLDMQMSAFLKEVDDAMQHPLQYNVYSGIAGAALMHFRMYQVEGSETFLESSLTYAERSLDLVKKKTPCEPTFLMGMGGPLALLAVLWKFKKDDRASEKYVKELKAVGKEVLDKDFRSSELLYGSVGYLYSLLFVEKYTGTQEVSSLISQLASLILKVGRENTLGFNSPLMYQWHQSPYLAAAHGLTGILYVLLDVPAVRKDSKAMKDIQSAADFLLSLRFPSGNYPTRVDGFRDDLVQWCHGAPAMGLFYCKMFEIFKDEKYLKEAELCAWVVWHRGLLKKGIGLCHGVSGNGYLFLKLYNITGDREHLWRAQKFCEFILSEQGKSTYKTPDRPYSLMEGIPGAVCFILDVLHPATTKFPAYDL